MKLQFRFFTLRGSAAPSAQQRIALEQSVESVVDGVEPRMRLCRGYQKKLQPAVSIARDYIDRLVERIPGPLDVSPQAFVSDPHVNAFFATPDEVRTVFSASEELRAFFERAEPDVESACALLCMVAQEKQVLGMDLANGSVRRDVHQTAVNFSDHKVLTPGATEADARRGLKDCIFNALVSHALQHIADLKARGRDLQDQRRILYARLQARRAYNGGLDTLLGAVTAGQTEGAEIALQLAQAEERLQQMPATHDAPRSYVHEVKAILERPKDFIRLRRVTFSLSRMGIKLQPGSGESGHAVELADIEVDRVLRRVVVIARYPRSQMLPDGAGWQSALMPSLG